MAMIRDFALLSARFAIGLGMAAHGAQKALGWFDGPGPEKAAGYMHSLGFRPGETYAPLAAWNEIGSGLAIALGAGGPAGPAAMISNMIVAGESVHRKNGFFAQKGGIEVAVLYGAAALAFAGGGYGAFSFDAITGLDKKLSGSVLTTLALTGGVAAAVFILKSRDMAPETPAVPTFQGKNSPLSQVEPA
jgi:putative oxidoreductase